MKVYAFIVTYNRFELLKKVVDCLRNQTYPIDQIVVINNSSTDGVTGPWLEKQKDLEVITQPNLGGAGGFHTGTKYCFEKGADWIWMMDDDVFPEPNCLEELLKYKDVSQCLNINRYYRDDVLFPFPAWSVAEIYKNSVYFNNSTDNLYVKCPNGICFEGVLLSKQLIIEVGLPDNDFFISGDDTTYGCVIAKTFCMPIKVKSAIAMRQQLSTEKELRPLYLYYTVRNHHILKKYKVRYSLNNLQVNSALYQYFILPLFFPLKIIFKGGNNKVKLLKALYYGIKDGYLKKIGPSHTSRKF